MRHSARSGGGRVLRHASSWMWVLVGVLVGSGWWGGSAPVYAQVPGPTPGLHDPDLPPYVAAVNVPRAAINAALAAAGRPPILPGASGLPHPDSVTLYVEIPAPKHQTPWRTRPTLPGPPYVAAMTPEDQAPAATTAATLLTGLDFNDNATLNGGYLFIPPDPSGAVGTSHVCHVVNVSIHCQTRAGADATGFPKGLATFFSSLSPLTFTFDPKILYDQFEDRFVAVTLEKTDTFNGDAANTSRLLLAVSDDGDPSGTGWHFQSIDALLSIGGTDRWCDYPGFAVDEEAIYVTCNYFSFGATGSFGGTRVWIIDKGTTGGLYAGAASSVSVHDPVSSAGSGFATTMQPAHIYGVPPGGSVGTWLVSYSGLSGGGTEYLQLFRIDDPLGSPSFTQTYVAVDNLDNTGVAVADAPQLGTSTLIDAGDRRALQAVWQGGELWSTATVVPPTGTDAGQVTAHWFRTSTAATPTSLAHGDVGGEDIATGAYTFYPALAINPGGDVGIGFAASHGTMYAGTYFAVLDPDTGTLSPTETVQAGVDYYVRTFGGSRNRWGDYTDVALDPADGGMWVINQAALARGTSLGGEDGRWGVFLAQYPASALPVELVRFDAVADARSVTLTWATAGEVNNAGFEVQHAEIADAVSSDGADAWRAIAWVAGHGTTAQAQAYTHRLADLAPGRHTFRLKQVDFDGAFEYSPEVEISVAVPGAYVLSDLFPNPFDRETAVTLRLAAAQHAVVHVYDVVGRRVAVLHDGLLEADRTYRFVVDGARLPAGAYFIHVRAERFTATRSVLRL